MTRGRAPRAGFTLIEVLTAIAIVVMLIALTVAGITRVRQGAMVSASEESLGKIQVGLDQQWKTVVDQCMEDHRLGRVPQNLVSYCDNDRDLARALWTYMQMKREFPQNFGEATASFSVGDNTSGYTTVQPRQTFASVANVGGPTADEQSAILLYLILAEKGNRGMKFDVSVMQTAELGPFTKTVAGNPPTTQQVNFTVFKDAWNTPISFARFFTNSELQQPPYADTKSNIKDRLDPLGKLATWATVDPDDNQNPKRTKKAITELALGVSFNGSNNIITPVCAGPNKQFEGNATGWTDDLWGYRARRQGSRTD